MARNRGSSLSNMMPRYFCVLSLLLIVLVRAGEDLKVTMGTSTISAQRGESVTIPCNIANIDNNQVIAVEWKKTLENSPEKDVYVYNNGLVTAYREGSSMDVEEVLKGNANLHLPNVQISDDGEYTCSVTNTPKEASGKTALQVSVPPLVTITPEDVTIELETEKSVMCEVFNFYPQTVTIRWVRYNKASPEYVTLNNGTCTAEHITNSDGTFRVTSQLTLKPKKEYNGNSYGCVVTHRSIDHDVVRNFTVTVTERDNTGAIIGAVIGTLICTLLAVACVMIYVRVFKTESPILTDIIGNKELIHMSRTTLICQIMNYRPSDITVSVRLRRRGQQEEEIITCKYGDCAAPIRLTKDGGCVVLNEEDQHKLVNTQDNRSLQLEVDFVSKGSKPRFFSCQCSLHITPSYDLDNGAELSIYVKHPARTSPISVRRTLNVVGDGPNQKC
ncbi:natural cytotoxicity triggering receptor 3 ligand 1-like [Hyperolius riggenbachi]|uniref:natural cytotoxicity triggering receptor 3 ligand 1-like n=1 Tax=Hyperolius riggenbachi TaxID=752182 RepID=UPI0035A33FB4